MRQNRSSLFLGFVLILIGGWMFVTRQVPSVREWLDANFIWPMWTIGAGVLILLMGLITGAPGMAIPASIVAGIGGKANVLGSHPGLLLKLGDCRGSPAGPPCGGASRRGESSAGSRGALLLQHAHDVAFLHDEQLLPVDLDLGAAPLAEQHLVALLELDRDELTALVAAARTDGDDFALLGFLGGGVGDDDAARRLGLAVQALEDDAVV